MWKLTSYTTLKGKVNLFINTQYNVQCIMYMPLFTQTHTNTVCPGMKQNTLQISDLISIWKLRRDWNKYWKLQKKEEKIKNNIFI